MMLRSQLISNPPNGHVYKAARDYGNAEKTAKTLVDMRSRNHTSSDRSVAAANMWVACTYHDQLRTDKAVSTMLEAKEILYPGSTGQNALPMQFDQGFISATLTDTSRPVPTAICFPPLYPWRDIAMAASSMLSELNSQKSQRDATLAAITAEVKRALESVCGGPILTVQGRILVPKDVLQKNIRRTINKPNQVNDFGENEDVAVTKEETVVDLENIPVFLCNSEFPNAFSKAIETYAEEKGLPEDQFGNSWPTLENQGKEVQHILDAVASSHALQLKKTTKNGEFQFEPVYKGTYWVYSSLDNGELEISWMVGPINAIKRDVVTINLDKTSHVDLVECIVLWQKGGHTETFQYGSAGSSMPMHSKDKRLVPPPDPVSP